MLKIKDNVDLKDLKKFGFKHHDKWGQCGNYYDYNCKDNRTYLIIFENNREIMLHSGFYGDIPEYCFENQLDCLFDLINNKLVEKFDK